MGYPKYLDSLLVSRFDYCFDDIDLFSVAFESDTFSSEL